MSNSPYYIPLWKYEFALAISQIKRALEIREMSKARKMTVKKSLKKSRIPLEIVE